MKRAGVELRVLGPGDGERYNGFLARGVERYPDTLRIASEDIARTPFPTSATDDAVTLAAIERDSAGEEVWLGVGTVERETARLKRRHIAWVVRMLVEAQGRGIGRALLRALIARGAAMPGVSKLNLTVAAHNDGAVHLYSSEGFREFSREADAFRVGARSIVELSMSRHV